MKLNPDCVRDILMYYEEQTDGVKMVRFNCNNLSDTALDKYTPKELQYHFKQCEYSGFFMNVNNYLNGTTFFLDISPAAHEFLANIRSDNIWGKVKTTAKEIGSYSIKTPTQIASSVISSYITQQFK